MHEYSLKLRYQLPPTTSEKLRNSFHKIAFSQATSDFNKGYYNGCFTQGLDGQTITVNWTFSCHYID